MADRVGEARAAILLSTFNGAAFLREQLDSFLTQSHGDWVLYWRDDGSSDETVAIVEEFAMRAGQGRCVRIGDWPRRLGATASFLHLLGRIAPGLGERDVVAFADQDDVWLPEKLARGIDALGRLPRCLPGLYCARQLLVDSRLQPLAESAAFVKWAGFPAALTQNIATGCTLMMNSAGAALVAASTPSAGALHDWWCYLVVSAAGGRVIQDDKPVVLYRQHGRNLVGAPRSRPARALAALRRGSGLFMSGLRQNVAALAAQPHLLTAQSRAEIAAVQRALDGPWWRRAAVLRMKGLARQTWLETMLFRCWFLFG
jgi:glycosyltransferase involved in cell wall biosynthesis